MYNSGKFVVTVPLEWRRVMCGKERREWIVCRLEEVVVCAKGRSNAAMKTRRQCIPKQRNEGEMGIVTGKVVVLIFEMCRGEV